MNYIPKIDRRSFVVSAAAMGGGLALGLDIPFGGPQVIRAQDGSPEVNAWVVIDLAWIAVAKSVCGTSDWHGASRVPGWDVGLRRGAPATNSFFLCGLLQ
jgi:isoquinoline 1-oxidoreductase subunit beta